MFMKIIYGLSGQGFGHSTRCHPTINHLLKAGHDVRIYTYGQSLFMLEKDFGDRIFEIPGFTLSYQNNKLIYWRTILDNAKKIIGHGRQFKKIKADFDAFSPDLVITDFEPMTAFLAKTKHLPLISIDNQHQLTKTEVLLDNKKYLKDLIADKIVIKSMVWGADYYLVTSFFTTLPKNNKTFLFPPIIREDVLNLPTSCGDYVLVYEGANFERILPLLKKSAGKFVVVGPHRDGQDGNIIYHKFSTGEWLDLLKDAKAVIGTAGLSLLGECVYLKKPYFALPICQQVEQIINAEYLERLGYGDFSLKLKQTELDDFLANLERFQANLNQDCPAGNTLLFEKLDELIKKLS
jgi:uncharacterized protein (TIGR00661 family)